MVRSGRESTVLYQQKEETPTLLDGEINPFFTLELFVALSLV
jgi:hypothetical protein